MATAPAGSPSSRATVRQAGDHPQAAAAGCGRQCSSSRTSGRNPPAGGRGTVNVTSEVEGNQSQYDKSPRSP
jgi:hypothetical protein